MAITLNRRKPSWGDFSSGMLPKFMPLIAEQKRQQHDDDRGNGQHLHDLVDVAGIEADVAVDRRRGMRHVHLAADPLKGAASRIEGTIRNSRKRKRPTSDRKPLI